MRCGGCGRPRDETMAEGKDNAYEAEAVECHACAAIARAAKKLDGDRSAVSFHVSERTPAP